MSPHGPGFHLTDQGFTSRTRASPHGPGFTSRTRASPHGPGFHLTDQGFTSRTRALPHGPGLFTSWTRVHLTDQGFHLTDQGSPRGPGVHLTDQGFTSRTRVFTSRTRVHLTDQGFHLTDQGSPHGPGVHLTDQGRFHLFNNLAKTVLGMRNGSLGKPPIIAEAAASSVLSGRRYYWRGFESDRGSTIRTASGRGGRGGRGGRSGPGAAGSNSGRLRTTPYDRQEPAARRGGMRGMPRGRGSGFSFYYTVASSTLSFPFLCQFDSSINHF